VRPKGIVVTVLSMLSAYLIAYTLLSLSGGYAPIMQNAQGTAWSWTPKGFTDSSGNIQFRSPLVIACYPLWRLDVLFWHTELKHTPHP